MQVATATKQIQRARPVGRTSPALQSQRYIQPSERDFGYFLRGLISLAFSPITVPYRITKSVVTSRITVSIVLKLVLLGFLTLASAIFSVLAVGAWWYAWGTGGPVEVHGWLTYGSRNYHAPHAFISLPPKLFQDELKYDVQVEMELVRPTSPAEELSNFMIDLQLRLGDISDIGPVVRSASQPSLPPPPLSTTLLSSVLTPLDYLPPCVLVWPFRGLCPSRLLGYAKPKSKRSRQIRLSSPASGNDVYLLEKTLMEGVVIKPSRLGTPVGLAFVSVGREDASYGERSIKEVRTTGWVIVRFTPRPTGVRWLLFAHPLPPLLILPPLSLALTLSSSLIAFTIISLVFRGGAPRKPPTKRKSGRISPRSDAVDEKRRLAYNRRLEEKLAEERRSKDVEDAEKSALGDEGVDVVVEKVVKRRTDGQLTPSESTTTITASTTDFSTTELDTDDEIEFSDAKSH